MLPYLSLLTEALNSASVTDVPAEKYPLNSPTRLPNTIFIRGSGYTTKVRPNISDADDIHLPLPIRWRKAWRLQGSRDQSDWYRKAASGDSK